MADGEAEFDRMHQYYTVQGAKNWFEEIWPRATLARLELLESLAKVDEAQASFRRSSEDWSIREVALHVLKGSRNVRRLVELLATGRAGDASDIEPARDTTLDTITALRDGIRRDGIEWAALIGRLPPRPALQPTAPHPMFGELHARAWYLFQRTHDQDHRAQIDAIKAAAGYPLG